MHSVEHDKTLRECIIRGYAHALAVAGYSLRRVNAHVRVACAVDARQVARGLQESDECGAPHHGQ